MNRLRMTIVLVVAALSTAVVAPGSATAQGVPPPWPPALAKRILRQDASPTWLAYSPNGKLLAAAGFDGALRVWDADSGRLVRVMQGHSASIWGVVFSPDGRSLFSGGDDAKTVQWDVASGRKVREFKTYKEEAIGVSVSPDGKRLFTGSGPLDKVIKVFDLATGKLIVDVAGHADAVQAIVFLADGKSFVSCSNDGTLKVWDAQTYALKSTLTQGQPSFHIAISPDRNTLASADASGKVKLWNMTTGAELRQISAHTGIAYALAFAPNGKWLASVGSDRALRLWEVDSGKELLTLMPFVDQVWSVVFSPDGKNLAAAGTDGSVRIFDMGFLATNLGLTQ
jgi:WD40 repeat protein